MGGGTSKWLIWAARKISSQSPAYLPIRLSSAARKRLVDYVFPTAWMAHQADAYVSEAVGLPNIRKDIFAHSAVRWHWDETDVPAILNMLPDDRRTRTVDQAEEIVRRTFTFRGRSPKTLSTGDWSPCGVSRGWIWDLNRHHWFAALGFAYRYTGQTRFINSFVEQSSDWMDHHLGRLGRIGWDNPFEVASRINAWLWAHFLFLSSPAWPLHHYRNFVRGLGLLAEYLNQTIENHAPGNHILLEAKTLALVGEALPGFRGSARWRRKGWRILCRELQRQICSDGVHAERSTMYHRIVAGELAELWFFCLRNHHPQASLLGEYVERMADFLRWIDQGDGQVPLFGDAQIEDTYYRFSAPAAAEAASNMVLRCLATESTDHSYWLLGGSPCGVGHDQPMREVSTGRAFPEGGYYVARSGWMPNADVLVWDCGPAGYHLNRKHAHLDALSFTLSVAGTPLLIDPGVHESDRHPVPLRSTRAHTTVCIDGEEQGILAERGEIWSPPNPELRLWATSPECTVMAGSHDGYRRLTESVRVVRTIITMHGQYWLIVDSIEGSGRHRVEQRFHVVPDAQAVLRRDENCVALTKGHVSLSLSWAIDPRRGPDVAEATPKLHIEPSLAELYCGRPEKSWMITAGHLGQVPTSLAVVASSAGRDVRVRWENGTDWPTSLLVTSRDFEHRVRISGGTNCVSSLPGGWRTDAYFVIIRRAAGAKADDVLLPRTSNVWRENYGLAAVMDEPATTEGIKRIVLP